MFISKIYQLCITKLLYQLVNKLHKRYIRKPVCNCIKIITHENTVIIKNILWTIIIVKT